MQDRHVVSLLRGIEHGFVKTVLIGESFAEQYCGIIRARVVSGEFEGYEIHIFNDCDEWDYVDSIRSPDGEVVWKWPVGTPYSQLSLAASYEPDDVCAWERLWEDMPVIKSVPAARKGSEENPE